MCRYARWGRDYRTSYVCVPCRHVAQFQWVADHPYRCPMCREPLTFAGTDFQAPRKRDDSGWTAVAAVLASGKNYHSCGCNGPGPRPRTAAQVRQEALERPRLPPNGKGRESL